ncbi:MAG TPA: hypothetical protein VMH27_10375 [Puia sp.]|nr:hypothetical protein [Puia sp.]
MKSKHFLLVVVATMGFAAIALGQEKRQVVNFSAEQLKSHWEKFTADPGFSALLQDAKSKGFTQIQNDKAMYGYQGTITDGNGKEHEVIFCAYDFYNPKAEKGQGCSMIWKRVDGRLYKAYLIFPEGEKDFSKAMAGAMEWYADEEGKVQRAHSWGSCFLKCVQTDGKAPGIDVDIKNGKVNIGGTTYTLTCSTSCFVGAIVCTAAAGAVAASGAGVPFAIGMMAVCAGLTCAPCLTMCAIGCM